MHLLGVLGEIFLAPLPLATFLAPQSTVLQEGLSMGIGPLLVAGLEIMPEISELGFLMPDMKGGLQIRQSVEIGLIIPMLIIGTGVGLKGLHPWIGDIGSVSERAS